MKKHSPSQPRRRFLGQAAALGAVGAAGTGWVGQALAQGATDLAPYTRA